MSLEPTSDLESAHPDAKDILIRFSSSSNSIGTFLKALEGLDPSRGLSHSHKPIDIRIQPIVPLVLDTVFVTVPKDLIQALDEIQTKFGGGFQHSIPDGPRRKEAGRDTPLRIANGLPKPDPASVDERLQTVIRGGLSRPSIVHSGDVVPLPLPSHPITHAPPPPAIVMACEPVNQGFISAKTKVVLVQAQSSHERALKKLQPPKPAMKQVPEDIVEDTEDTSNEQFFSAAEDRESETTSEADGASEADSDTNDSASSLSGDESDDSLEHMISLSAPSLPPQPSGTLSAMTAATPRPGGRRLNGAHTPGSIRSSYTATTNRPGRTLGKTFKAQQLLQRIPQDALFPKPGDDDDDDSFVFVDIHMLTKIGCFSGDWIKLELQEKSPNDYFGSLSFSGLGGSMGEGEDWRAVRVFGLPGLGDDRPRYAVDKTGDRRSSFSQMSAPVATATVFLSPLLFSSLGEMRNVKLSPLPTAANRLPKHLAQELKHGATKLPPVAKEIILTKIQTPSSTERTLDHAVFSRLQKYFEPKQRLLKTGDLIGLDVDEELARATYSPAKHTESAGETDLTAALSQVVARDNAKRMMVWFNVNHVSIDHSRAHDGEADEDPWGGVAVVDVNSTMIRQAGTENKSIQNLTARHWQYWYGIKKAPKPSSNLRAGTILAPMNSDLSIPSLQTRLRNLVKAATSPLALSRGLPPLVILLHSNQRQIGKAYTANQACASAGVHTFPISAYDVLAEGSSTSGGGDVKTEGYLMARAERAFQCGSQQTALLMQHIEQLTADRMLPTLKDIISSSRVLIATTTEIEKIPDGIRGLFTHELEVKAPDESERESILQSVVSDSGLRVSPSVSLRSVALKTAALVAGDLVDVVYRAALARMHRITELVDSQNAQHYQSEYVNENSVKLSGGLFTTHILPSDFESAITAARAAFSASISAPRIPSVTWNDVGGLASAKSSIMETISLPLTHPALFAKGLRKRSGILFYGPPGTGKTLLAKAIATEFSLNFFSVKGPELLNMYIGESEANVRRVFQRARDARPCVVFFDELDSVAPKRGNQGDSGGVMDRIVSQLLAELDGMSSGSTSDDTPGEGKETGSTGGGAGVFVIGATNRPDLLDPALLRPGRFDKLIYLGIPDAHEKQLNILQALTRKFTLAPEVDLQRVADRLPLTYTGADLYALASDAMLKAVTRRADETDKRVNELNQQRKARGLDEITTAWYFDHVATDDDVRVFVNEQDFDNAAKELVGSVSEKELKHFENIRRTFEQGEDNRGGAASVAEQMQNLTHTSPHRPVLPIRPSQQSSTTNSSPSSQTTLIHHPKGKGKSWSATHSDIANPDSGPDTDQNQNSYNSQHASDPFLNGSSHNTSTHNDYDSDDFVISTSHLKKSDSVIHLEKGKSPSSATPTLNPARPPPVTSLTASFKNKGKGKGKGTTTREWDEVTTDTDGGELNRGGVGGRDDDDSDEVENYRKDGGGDSGTGFMSVDEKEDDLY